MRLGRVQYRRDCQHDCQRSGSSGWPIMQLLKKTLETTTSSVFYCRL